MFLALTAALLVNAAPVAKEDVATAPAAPVTAPVAAIAAAPAPNPRVCFVDTPTGSHLRFKTCKTLQQWRALGIDPLAKK